MAVGVLMPKEGITVESCIMGSWKKKVGDTVKIGEPLFGYETDKAEFEANSTAEGTILEIFYNEGDEVPCLVNVCAVGNPGEDISSLRPSAEQDTPAPAAPAPAPAAPAPAAAAAAPSVTPQAAPAQAPAAADVRPGGKLAVSPRAKSLAERAGVDASLAVPTGPNGRIIERDIRALMESGITAQPAVKAASPAPAVTSEDEYEDVKFSAVRKATARSMMASLTGTAQLTLNFSFNATQIQELRAMLKGLEGDVSKISLNDMVMFAVARTLEECHDLNANMLDDTTIRLFRNVNLGFACDTPRGLLVPVIKHADTLTLLELALEGKRLAAKAKAGELSPDEMTGGTFTVSNLGSFGCESFTPVINPPQTGILGICNIERKLKNTSDGSVQTYPAMGLSLTIDHRAVDGAPASRFMKELCSRLEHFMALLAE